MDTKIINQKFDEADGKTFLPFRLIVKKLQSGEPIDWDYFSDLSNWSLLEDGRLLFKDENEPYEVQSSPEFLRKQKEDGDKQRQEASYLQNKLEADRERIRLRGLQITKERGEALAREEIDQDKLHQQEIEQALKEKLESQSKSLVSEEETSSTLNENEPDFLPFQEVEND